MNVELKIQVPLAKLSALAAAFVAVLGTEGAAQALVVAEPATTADTPAPSPEVKASKGKKSVSAVPAEAVSAAPTPAVASAPATESPTPSTSETPSGAGVEAELPVYEKTDIGPRIIAISEGGDADRIKAVKALLGTFQHNGFADKKAASGRHLRREDINEFNKQFTALEASWNDEAMG